VFAQKKYCLEVAVIHVRIAFFIFIFYFAPCACTDPVETKTALA